MDKSVEQMKAESRANSARYEQELHFIEELAKTNPARACQLALSFARLLRAQAGLSEIMAMNCCIEAEELERSEGFANAELAELIGKSTPQERIPLARFKHSGPGCDKGQISRVAKQMRAEDAKLPEADRRIQTLTGGTLTETELSKVFAEMEARRHRTRGRVNKNQQTKP
jgi:hypothetical protein